MMNVIDAMHKIKVPIFLIEKSENLNMAYKLIIVPNNNHAINILE